ncbi:hypothetical protein Trydic_g10897 [Trypoxylus dichotomus]
MEWKARRWRWRREAAKCRSDELFATVLEEFSKEDGLTEEEPNESDIGQTEVRQHSYHETDFKIKVKDNLVHKEGNASDSDYVRKKRMGRNDKKDDTLNTIGLEKADSEGNDDQEEDEDDNEDGEEAEESDV